MICSLFSAVFLKKQEWRHYFCTRCIVSLKHGRSEIHKKKLASLVAHLNSQSPENSSYFPFHIPLFVGSFHDSSEKMTFQAVSQTFSQKLSQSLLHSLHIYSHCIKIKQETNIYKAQYTVFLYAHS